MKSFFTEDAYFPPKDDKGNTYKYFNNFKREFFLGLVEGYFWVN